MSVSVPGLLLVRRYKLRWPRFLVLAMQILVIVAIATPSTSTVAPFRTSSVSAAGFAAASDVCPDGSRTITYDVVSFQTIIPVNGWGDHLPDGLIYALSNADVVPNKSSIGRARADLRSVV